LTLSKELQLIPGISGAAEDCVLPGYWGYEAGQTCVGDLFAWAAQTLMTESYAKQAHAQGMSDQQYLTELAQLQRPGQHGLVALDWWNGNRSILMDSDLTGLLMGVTLNTRPEDIYRALIEATAFGARTVVENYAAHGVCVSELFVTGGICKKNPMLMQIYADVLGMPLRVVSTTQGGALGSAIIAATAAGIYETPVDAIKAMASPCDRVYTPDPENRAIYNELYAIYRQLHDTFGKEGPQLMYRLNSIRKG
jgi:L-ribulokinase